MLILSLSLSLSPVLSPLLSSVEAHCSSCSEFESWLDEQEGKLEECGPIGADLNRLKEQTELLKVRKIYCLIFLRIGPNKSKINFYAIIYLYCQNKRSEIVDLQLTNQILYSTIPTLP